jgi:hypothetical protein
MTGSALPEHADVLEVTNVLNYSTVRFESIIPIDLASGKGLREISLTDN